MNTLAVVDFSTNFISFILFFIKDALRLQLKLYIEHDTYYHRVDWFQNPNIKFKLPEKKSSISYWIYIENVKLQ